MKIGQIICVLLEIIGCAGMGVHLFLMDGITNPGPSLTCFAVIFGIGMVGTLIFALLRIWEEKQK